MAGRKVSDNWGEGQTEMEEHGLCTGGPHLLLAPAMRAHEPIDLGASDAPP